MVRATTASEGVTTVVPNVDTDGDLLAVPPVSAVQGLGPDAPASAGSSWADFPEVSSHELGERARRIVDALHRRADDTARTQLHSLYESVSAAVSRPATTVGPDGWPEGGDSDSSAPSLPSDRRRP